jgi:cytochrome c553
MGQELVESRPDRMALMWHNFAQASRIHEALVLGDLDAVLAPALELAGMPVPQDVPALGISYVEGIRSSARRVADARTLSLATAATASMLKTCGDCHLAVGAGVKPFPVRRPDADGLVGQMLEHQRAVDEMLQGLVVPSLFEWHLGADRLRSAPLHVEGVSLDPALTADFRTVEMRVHAIADAAAEERDATARMSFYAQLVTSCAECHDLHNENRGPGQ